MLQLFQERLLHTDLNKTQLAPPAGCDRTASRSISCCLSRAGTIIRRARPMQG